MHAYYLKNAQQEPFSNVHLGTVSPFMYTRLFISLLLISLQIAPALQAQVSSSWAPTDSVRSAVPVGLSALSGASVAVPSSGLFSVRQSVTNRKRLYGLAGTSVLTLGSTYVYLQNKWWSEGYTHFGFDNGRDWRYASNVDKLGHLLGGVFTADAYYAGFRWAGVPQRRAEWYAVGAAAFVQLSIEFKDGFSPRYGFSWADVTVGTLGGFWPMLQHRSPFLHDSQFKFSYWQRTAKYFEHRGIKTQPFSIDDYINQTYWFSFSPGYVGRSAFGQRWPAWLQVSIGAGLEADTWSIGRTGEGGRWEWYLAPDVNLEKLFKPRRPWLRTTLHLLHYIKVPAPTLQVGPNPKFWWIYF